MKTEQENENMKSTKIRKLLFWSSELLIGEIACFGFPFISKKINCILRKIKLKEKKI